MYEQVFYYHVAYQIQCRDANEHDNFRNRDEWITGDPYTTEDDLLHAIQQSIENYHEPGMEYQWHMVEGSYRLTEEKDSDGNIHSR